MDSELTDLAAVKAINQGLTTTSNVSFGNVTLSGDLVVNGTTTTLNTTNLNVEDQFILVNSGSTAKDAGLYLVEQVELHNKVKHLFGIILTMVMMVV